MSFKNHANLLDTSRSPHEMGKPYMYHASSSNLKKEHLLTTYIVWKMFLIYWNNSSYMYFWSKAMDIFEA
jgi:hypothetical protein